MTRSMTAFASYDQIYDDLELAMSIKSVNSKYFDLKIRMPYYLNYLENDIRNFIKSNISRGTVDLYIDDNNYFKRKTTKKISFEASKNYYENITELNKLLGLNSKIVLSDILSNEDIFLEEKIPVDEVFRECIFNSLDKLIVDFNSHRDQEGKNLIREIDSYLKEINCNVLLIDEIDKKSIPIKQKLENKYKEYFGIIDDYVETRFFKNFKLLLIRKISQKRLQGFTHILSRWTD